MTPRPDLPAPNSRRGPRPLLLHLSLAMLRSSVSAGTSPHWKTVWRHLSDRIPPPSTPKGEAAAEDAAFAQAVCAEALRQDAALIAGIAAYRRFPYARALADPPTLWAEGETRLLDFAPPPPGAHAGPRAATPILFVPSLINRAYILDLAADASFMRWLAAQGFRPLLLDWGWTGEAERCFTLTDYVAGRLERALAAAGGAVVLAGYCMGGLLALAAALRNPRVRALALLATPWDFHAADAEGAAAIGRSAALLEPLMQLTGTVPVDALQTLFALLDPFGVSAKYRDFAALDAASPRARRFVALEDWLADGVPLAAPVARECFGQWYGANTPARGAWRIAGLPVRPETLAVPWFMASPARDRLVPPESARPLAALLARAGAPGLAVEPQAGHIGMVAGTQAQHVLWEPFARWLSGLF